jgi:hypothetical protein
MRIFLGSSAKLDAAKPSKVRKETLKEKITPSKKLLSKNSSPGTLLCKVENYLKYYLIDILR